MGLSKELLEKHKVVLDAARKYYVDQEPTGLTDEEYDRLEKLAQDDGIEPRNVVTEGQKRVKNADYLTKIPKQRAGDKSMRSEIQRINDENNGDIYWELKYDGSSIVAYFENGVCYRVVTAGGDNLNGMGVDQTEKLSKYFPKIDSRIKCLHCEALVSLDHPEITTRHRQKANGLVTSTKEDMLPQVDKLLNIRAFRFFSDYDLLNEGPISIMRSLPIVVNDSMDIKFSPCQIYTTEELLNLGDKVLEGNHVSTNSGTFRFDGFVAYNKFTGEVVTAIKSDHGGVDDLSEVVEMLWNELSGRGKDGWSLNVRLDPPANVNGSMIRKPSSGGVPTAIRKNITPGAKVKIGLGGGTIPKVTEVVEGGSGEMSYPICECGYQTSEDDIFGNNVKCGNPDCSMRYSRMLSYLTDKDLPITEVDLNALMIIDRFDFRKKSYDYSELMNDIKKVIENDEGPDRLKEVILEDCDLRTSLQRRNLDLVIIPTYKSLIEYYGSKSRSKD